MIFPFSQLVLEPFHFEPCLFGLKTSVFWMRYEGLKWEKSLDEQREHRLIREGFFYHDSRLDGLSDDDRPWM